jgi:hypothetical protein
MLFTSPYLLLDPLNRKAGQVYGTAQPNETYTYNTALALGKRDLSVYENTITKQILDKQDVPPLS